LSDDTFNSIASTGVEKKSIFDVILFLIVLAANSSLSLISFFKKILTLQPKLEQQHQSQPESFHIELFLLLFNAILFRFLNILCQRLSY
jgi:hypothetical protein